MEKEQFALWFSICSGRAWCSFFLSPSVAFVWCFAGKVGSSDRRWKWAMQNSVQSVVGMAVERKDELCGNP